MTSDDALPLPWPSRPGFAARNPSKFVSVAFSISTTNFSPLSGVMRLIGNRRPYALRLSMRMPRKSRKSPVDMARITSGLDEAVERFHGLLAVYPGAAHRPKNQ